MSSIFEFSISELGYREIFMKSEKKFFDLFFKPFLTNRGKIKNENEKIGENEFDFSITRIKIRLYDNFHGNLLKKFQAYFSGHF